MTIKEAVARGSNYSVFAAIKSKAKTLKGINAAIKRNVSANDTDEWFYSMEEIKRAENEGFISFHDDGFILWVDGE